jgi:hypothetical protein
LHKKKAAKAAFFMLVQNLPSMCIFLTVIPAQAGIQQTLC